MALTFESITLKAAAMPRENPLPPLKPLLNLSSQINMGDEELASEMQTMLSDAPLTLPYLNQDDYDRDIEDRPFKAIVLENDWLRAVFLPELGGRLWELIHKPTGLNLVWTNPVLRFANLAVRDAWFAGGIEWNIGILGHSPFTSSPVFAGTWTMPDGAPVLRIWEWERIRCVTWQVDFILPEDSPFLMVRPRIANPNDRNVLMYWWSNVAVEEREDVRVLSPAVRAKRHDYNKNLIEHIMPHAEGVDASYPTRRKFARDMYMIIPPEERPWAASLNQDGRGLFIASTSHLRGRKAFNWGTSPGGRTWQSFLSQPGEAYYELQAGLTPTQTEYVLMPARACWQWMEAYGLLEVSPKAAHSEDWSHAHSAARDALNRILPQEELDTFLAETNDFAAKPPESIIFHASNWGALELERRRHMGESVDWAAATPFLREALGEEQLPWLELLSAGRLRPRDVASPPLSPMVQPEWHALLEDSLQYPEANHWLTWYQLGIARFRTGDHVGAEEAWRKSIECQSNGWAYRNLAVLASLDNRNEEAVELYRIAQSSLPHRSSLAAECLQALIDAGKTAEALQIAKNMSKTANSGRTELLKAQAALHQNDFDTVKSFFDRQIVVANIREGETSTSDLWFEFQERRMAMSQVNLEPEKLREYVREKHPVPAGMDFRPTSE